MINSGVNGPRPNVRLALFALSGNECAFPDCDEPMYADGSVLGEVCHIHARGAGGARYLPELSDEELHGIQNLILLCRRHHKLVDDKPEGYPAEALREMKRNHEARAKPTSSQVLVRLVQMLVPEVPEAWEDRPGVPVFRLQLASTRPDSGVWTYMVDLEQAAGGDVGGLKYRYRHGGRQGNWESPRLRRDRKWSLSEYRLSPIGELFAIELTFWWDGALRTVSFEWDSESHFQGSEVNIDYR